MKYENSTATNNYDKSFIRVQTAILTIGMVGVTAAMITIGNRLAVAPKDVLGEVQKNREALTEIKEELKDIHRKVEK